MGRAIAFVCFCLLGAVVHACTTTALPQAAPAPLNEEWLRSDEKRIAQLRDALGRADLTVELLREIAGSSDVREDRAIGFGARRVRLALYGGYTTIWVNLLAAEPDEHGRSLVAALQFEQRGAPETWAVIAPRLRKAWEGSPAASALGERESAITYERRDTERLAALRARMENVLGAVDASEVPSELARAFELLTSPYEELVIGRSCSTPVVRRRVRRRSARSSRRAVTTSCDAYSAASTPRAVSGRRTHCSSARAPVACSTTRTSAPSTRCGRCR